MPGPFPVVYPYGGSCDLATLIAPEKDRLSRLLPGAQPLLCALFLATGKALERTAPGAAGLLYVLAYLAGGTGSAWAAWNALRRLRIDINFLMLLAAVGAAYLGQWPEGGILLFLFSLSNALEYYVMRRTRRAIRALMSLQPAKALVRRGRVESVVPADALRVSDVIVVRPGERLPADGVVVAGSSSIDQAPITGESIPVDAAPGSLVFAGTINQRGSLDVEVRRNPEETVLARIIALVEGAQSAQVPAQRLIDRFGQGYALLVILASAGAYALLGALGAPRDVSLYRAITLLVVASPCAVVISTPATILSAIANAARRGVLFKGGAYLEVLGRADTVVLDKTGTLTVGRPSVTDVVPLEGSEATLLTLAAALEQRSEHALADAIVVAARARGIDPLRPDSFEAVPGRGVRGSVAGTLVRIGNEAFLRDEGLDITEETRGRLTAFRRQGKTPVLVGDDHVRGIIALADRLRPQAIDTVRALRTLGIRHLMMLSGDHRQAAGAIGRELGLDDVRAELLPHEKAEVVRDLVTTRVVVMVGDGINDAPALAAASAGIAMGMAGTDVAMETADVVLMGDDLGRLPFAIGLSRYTHRVIVQNLTFAGLVIAGLIVAVFGVGLRLAFGVIGHEGSTVIVILNGLRLLGYHYRLRPRETDLAAGRRAEVGVARAR
jgi:Zn2+/Cd2+-exporting ATPase